MQITGGILKKTLKKEIKTTFSTFWIKLHLPFTNYRNTVKTVERPIQLAVDLQEPPKI